MSEYWEGKKVFVTGATGVVGSWLVKELLARRARVTVLLLEDAPQSELIRSGDIRGVSVLHGALEDFPTLERGIGAREIDTVFHLGAQTIVGTAHWYPLATLEANVRGTYNLLEACRHGDSIQRVVIASSDKAYGEQPRLPYDEEMPLNGRHPYEVSKSCADLIAQTYHRTYGLPVAIARCGNVYGGGDLNWSRIVPGTIKALLRRQSPVIRSDGTYVRDYVYVVDIARAYLRLAECLDNKNIEGQAFNFSDEKPVTVLEMVGLIQKLLGCDDVHPDIRACAEGEIHSQHLSARKARTLLQWEPEFDLPTGLRRTIAWYQDFFSGA